MTQRRDQGLALILVMTVVMALAIIATPFVISMLLQERTGTTARYLSQADYGADGAKNYAMWRLMMSVDPIERRGGSGLFSSYTYDTLQEFDIRLDDPTLNARLKISDPKGSIWGITVQDEQGKLNTRTCSLTALDTLSKMVDGRVINLKDYLTIYSGRDASWVCPQRIRAVGYDKGTPSGGGITVDNLHVLAPKSRVRVTKAGMKSMETRISGNALLASAGNNGFTTDQSVTGYLDGVIEVEQRHPVNVNTAKRETLIAMFTGLHLWDPKTGGVMAGSEVDQSSAMQLATRFAGRDLQRLESFLLALAGTSLNINQKKAVALNAVCPNAAMLMQSGTVPICFKSYDVYTLEAASSMNNPAGTEVAGRGYREVVSVSPPTTLHRWCESQYDFNQMISQLATAMQGLDPKLAFGGYPYGNRLLSYPNPITQMADTKLKPQGKGSEAYVTVLPAEDHRGELLDNRFEGALTGNWDSAHNRSHYATEMDGKKTSGPETFDWTQFFAFNFVQEDDPPQSTQRPDTGSGGFEIWTKFDSDPGSASIFDIQEQPTTNRVSLHIEGGDVILTAADSTIPYSSTMADANGKYANGVAEIHFTPMKKDFKLSPETWTHFSAHWKSNRYADLALLIDGFSHPDAKFGHFTGPSGTPLMTKLSSALTPMATTISLNDSNAVPSSELTPIQVGDEVILYDSSGSSAAIRGARGTQALDHPSQAVVSMFGYSSKIRNGQVKATYNNGYTVTMDFNSIPQTNATLKFNFDIAPSAQVAGDKMNPGPPPFYEIDAIQNQIGVIGNVMGFPDQGYIRIDNEIIYYTSRSTAPVGGSMPLSTGQFAGCQRAQFGSTAATHRSLATVQMWSIAVTNLNNYPSPTIIQVGDEWFGPVLKDPTGKNFWVGFMNPTGNVPENFQRGYQCLYSIPQSHTSTEKVIPTFLGRDVNSWPSQNLASMGAGDRVTLVDASNQKASARIRRASTDPRPNLTPPPAQPVSFGIQGNPQPSQIVALYDHATRAWVADDLHVRVLKFPSGELLSRIWLDTAMPKVTIGPIGGQIDELKAFAGSKGRIRLIQQAGAGDASLQVNHTAIPFKQDGGLLKIGDEYIGYGQWTDGGTQGTVNPAKRGWLNSSQELHDRGDGAFYLSWIPVSALASDVTPDDKVVHLKQHLSGDPKKYTKGYVLVDNEMMLFEWNDANGQNAGQTLSMPPRWDGTTGLYRGMFGTQAQQHSAGQSLVYGMPYRYYDTFKAREFDNSMVYFQWSVKMDLAKWNTFSWVQELPPTEKNIVVHAFARVDGRGEFWDPPNMNDNVLLVESVMGGAKAKLNRTSYLGDAGQLDVRFYVEYKPGSFDAQNPRTAESWKRCPKIKQIEVEYDRPSQTLHHEDR
jgi:hypothetical protein